MEARPRFSLLFVVKWERKDKLKKKSELEELENSQPVYTLKNGKEIMGVT